MFVEPFGLGRELSRWYLFPHRQAFDSHSVMAKTSAELWFNTPAGASTVQLPPLIDWYCRSAKAIRRLDQGKVVDRIAPTPPIPQDIQNTLFDRYQPLLQVYQGCQPDKRWIQKVSHLRTAVSHEQESPTRVWSHLFNRSQSKTNVTGRIPCQRLMYVRKNTRATTQSCMPGILERKQDESLVPFRSHRHSWHHVILWFCETKLAQISIEKNGNKYSASDVWMKTDTHPWIGKYFDQVSLVGVLKGSIQPLVSWDDAHPKRVRR
ncbi:hypothetical protein MRB53_039790 [Persea americana]|nr:hypothetical protein MRB53_039790 [Persea americana]